MRGRPHAQEVAQQRRRVGLLHGRALPSIRPPRAHRRAEHNLPRAYEHRLRPWAAHRCRDHPQDVAQTVPLIARVEHQVAHEAVDEAQLRARRQARDERLSCARRRERKKQSGRRSKRSERSVLAMDGPCTASTLLHGEHSDAGSDRGQHITARARAHLAGTRVAVALVDRDVGALAAGHAAEQLVGQRRAAVVLGARHARERHGVRP
eukprot:6480973-Prymnesium_polylepis.1